MGTAKSGDSEVIRVTLIDYFSSDILIDSLVYPDVEMAHYNTRFSGVTKKDMEFARARGKCFRGRNKARAGVWQFVGPDTVVVGHSPNNDLTAMRWIHSVVVDTFLIESTIPKDPKGDVAKEEKPPEPSTVVLMDNAVSLNKDQQTPPKRRKGSGTRSLKTLSMVRLGREIQTGGKKGHDSLEDAVATRDLAHWHVVHNNSEAPQAPHDKCDPALVVAS